MIESKGMSQATTSNMIMYERSVQDVEKLSKVQPMRYDWNFVIYLEIAHSGMEWINVEETRNYTTLNLPPKHNDSIQ